MFYSFKSTNLTHGETQSPIYTH